MRLHRLAAFVLLVVAAPLFAQEGRDVGPLRDGDRVLFYGDSITEQLHYPNYLEAYAVTRFPEVDVTFRNVGVGGDRVTGGRLGDIDTRLQRDVFPFEPTVVTICLGMNDGGYAPFGEEAFQVYREGLRHIVDRLQEEGVERIVLITPGIVDTAQNPDLGESDYNETLRRYGEYVLELAQEEGVAGADIFTRFLEASEALRAMSAEATLVPDAVHPNQAGHLVMAFLVLDALDAPGTVAEYSVTAEGRVEREVNTQITGLVAADGMIAFAARDRALPMPIDPEAAVATQLLPIRDELNRHILEIDGLAADQQYEVAIDGQVVAQVSGAELGEGINLSEYETPMSRQALDVLGAIAEKNAAYLHRWQHLELGPEPANDEERAARQAEIESADAEIAELEARLRTAAQPQEHQFEIRPAE